MLCARGEKEARDMERNLHNSLERMQRHIRGEWYRISLDETCKDFVDRLMTVA